jgi:hypothetical protein
MMTADQLQARGDAYRAALELTREALAIPYAATDGDDRIRSEVLQARALQALLMIGSILDDHGPDQLGFTNAERAAHAMEYCRRKLAENPADCYRTSGMHLHR